MLLWEHPISLEAAVVGMGNLGLILIDYLQLITGTEEKNRQQEVSEISRQLKILPWFSSLL